MTDSQSATASAETAALIKHNQGDALQAVQPNPYLNHSAGVESRIQKHIDSIDSQISTIQKDIGKLLNL